MNNRFQIKFTALLLAAVLSAGAPAAAFASANAGSGAVLAAGSGTETSADSAEPSSEEKKAETEAPTTTAAPETEAPTTAAPPETTAAPVATTAQTPETKETSAEAEQPAAETTAEAAADPTADSGENTTAEAEETTEKKKKKKENTSEAAETTPETGAENGGYDPTGAVFSESQERASESAAEASSIAEQESLMLEFLPIIPADIIFPEYKPDFRFIKVDKKPALLKDKKALYTSKESGAKVVGAAEGDTLVFILEKAKDWCFVESGYVRGFAKTSDLDTGDAAKTEMKKQEAWQKKYPEADTDPFGHIKPRIGHMSNPAFDYTRTTTMETLAEKRYALAAKEIAIYDKRSAALDRTTEGNGAQIIGTLTEGGLMYILVNHGKTAFVESGDVRGFVNTEDILSGDSVKERVEKRGDDKYTLAEEKIPWEKNSAIYYTIESVEQPRDPEREAVIRFALQFIGCPYKWGGTNLTGGIDCSGFVQAVYRQFGYSLPRTSAAQRNYGIQIDSLKDALPGDIICYQGHVALYLGNGQIVHASNSKPYPRGGVKVSKVGIRPIIGIRRIIK